MAFRISRFLLFLLFFASSASAYYHPGNPSGFVNDYTGILSIGQKQELESKLLQFEKDSGNEISVVIISNLQGDTIENFAVELFKNWGIGKKGKDNGILILVALQDRKMRIEVGYGLEGALTDAQSSLIINDMMKPAFRENNYYQGIDSAVSKIIFVLNKESAQSDNKIITKSKNTLDLGSILIGVFFGFFIFLNILGNVFGRILGKSKSYWAGGLIGALIGGIIGFFLNSLNTGLLLAGILGMVGLVFDYFVSRVIKTEKGKNRWFGGFGGGGGGGFGGFGGGGSGGGGSSGGW